VRLNYRFGAVGRLENQALCIYRGKVCAAGYENHVFARMSKTSAEIAAHTPGSHHQNTHPVSSVILHAVQDAVIPMIALYVGGSAYDRPESVVFAAPEIRLEACAALPYTHSFSAHTINKT
jgi:hypothetical protein